MIKKYIFFIVSILFFTNPSGILASNIVFEEDFSENLEKWEPTRDSGDLWKIIDGMVEVKILSKFYVTELVPKDKYWSNQWKNIEYSLDIIPIAGVDRNISFYYNDLLNWYEIHFIGNVYNLLKLSEGSVPFSINESGSLINNQVNHVKIKLIDDKIIITVNNEIIADLKNDEFSTSNGKIGIKAGTGAVSPTYIKFDNIVVRSLDNEQSLDVPDIKQTNLTWADQQYDTATDWSQDPTINRWGCALSSLSMILNFHKIDKMSDGNPTTPDHLNTWLKSQPDGYIGQGLLNWVAATRLARELNEKYQTTKLEYSKSLADHLVAATNEINLGRPTILQLPGHFVVAKGISGDQSDLIINDPASTQTSLNQLSSQLLSTRIFQPSQTDLSYLIFVHDPDIQVTIANKDGSPIENIDYFDDAINSQNQSETLPFQNIIHIPKPADGKYLINVSRDQHGPFSLQIFSYDDQANPTLLHQTGAVGPLGKTFELDYPANQIELISNDCDFKQFRQTLNQEYTQKNIKKYYAFALIDKLASYAQNADAGKSIRYSNYLKVLLEKYHFAMTDQTFDELNNLLCY